MDYYHDGQNELGRELLLESNFGLWLKLERILLRFSRVELLDRGQ